MIFQIGFNKAGTGSLYWFFKENGFNAAHWEHGEVSKRIFDNHNLGQPLLSGLEHYDVFTDMEHYEGNGIFRYVAMELIEQLIEQYPKALFIFNTRNKNAWLKSRINHDEGSYLKRVSDEGGHDIDAVISRWGMDYEKHTSNVLKLFIGNPRFLYFNIDTMNNDTLISFLNNNGIEADASKWKHRHKTKNKKVIKNPEKNADILRDLAIYFEDKRPAVALELIIEARKIRPGGKTINDKYSEIKRKVEK